MVPPCAKDVPQFLRSRVKDRAEDCRRESRLVVVGCNFSSFTRRLNQDICPIRFPVGYRSDDGNQRDCRDEASDKAKAIRALLESKERVCQKLLIKMNSIVN